MPALSELISELNSLPSDKDKSEWLNSQLREALTRVSELRAGANVIFYASAFLQKPGAPSQYLSITHEDINGFMTGVHTMDCERGLELLVHTPGGVTNATETIVEYLRNKFSWIEAIVPTYAISAGTMISLACNRVVMGKQSQLGPIDSQMMIGGRSVSAQAIVDQFKRAKEEILSDSRMANVWAPVLRSFGPALVEEARRALRYGEDMVCEWLQTRMLAEQDHPAKKARKIAKHFNSSEKNSSHGRRISRDEALAQGVNVEVLEENQELQEAVLTAYHLMTMFFELSPAAKVIYTHEGRTWIKNVLPQSKKTT